MFDSAGGSVLNLRPSEPLRITCLTIGSRGDIQPFIALCKGLKKDGQRPRIATHLEFKDFVEGHGIEFAPVEGDPTELMRICVENGMFSVSFLKEANTKFRGWIDDLLKSAWKACQGSDVLIESPVAMAGLHIAESLGIPYFRAFTMPWTRTRAYPHAFAVPNTKLGGAYNYYSYVLFENIFWQGISGQVNSWRRKSLGLKSTNLLKMRPNRVPFYYNFSPSVVTPPLDWADWIRVTGYWFLENSHDTTTANWEPPSDLQQFMQSAKQDGKKLAYIGFGSVLVSDAKALTETVINAVLQAGIRCILSKGWAERLNAPREFETDIPPEIYAIDAIPHEWLFPQVDVAVHHGGSGTTGASLRAGVPTIIKPFFGDQFFWASRIEDLKVGRALTKMTVNHFAHVLDEVVSSPRMASKAKDLGAKIRSENGVATAIQCLYRDMEYAKSLAHRTTSGNTTSHMPSSPHTSPLSHSDDDGSWTFVDDDQTGKVSPLA